MKMQEGLFDFIDKEESEPFHLYSMLCPGHSSSKEEARLITLNTVESVHETYAGEWGDERHLVTDEFLRFDGSSSSLSSLLHDEISPDSNKRYIRERAPTGTDNDGRRLRWSRSLQDAIGSQECADALSLVTVDATSDGQTSFIDFPDDITTSCLHALVAALSIAPQVCSIGLVPEVQATNLEAQWITQSGITEDRPFFDVGLTGKDQVVAVSDSGLDVDSCYFMNDGGDVRKDGSVDMTQRKVVQYVPFADSSDYRGGHGTHVVGTVLGHRSDDGQSERDGAANGVAKDAKGETYVPVFGRR
jgi:subtilisin family serine protease